jgi:predicted dehydrogenase
VADASADRAAAAAQATGAEAMTDYRAMIGKVDAVSIAVPTIDHLRVARDFLNAGIHVLVEKPMTATLAEAEELLAVADRTGCVLASHPAVAAAIPLISGPAVHRGAPLSDF